MFYNVLKATELVDYHTNKIQKKVLMENEGSSLVAIAIKKDEIIDTHTSICDAAVLVFDGKIEMHFAAEKFTVNRGEILMFKKDSQHKVLAVQDSKFFIVKI